MDIHCHLLLQHFEYYRYHTGHMTLADILEECRCNSQTVVYMEHIHFSNLYTII